MLTFSAISILAADAGGSVVPPPTARGATLLAVLLLISAVGIALSIALKGRRPRLNIRSAGSTLIGMLGAIPVLAVTVFAAGQAAPLLQTEPVEPASPTSFVFEEGGRIGDEPAPPDSPLGAEDADLPEWIREGNRESIDGQLAVISSKQYATIEEAEEEAYGTAAEILQQRFHARFPDGGEWTIPRSAIIEHAQRLRHDQAIDRETERFSFTAHRVHLQIVLSDESVAELQPYWREQVSDRRVRGLGGLFLLAITLIGSLAAYLRLDEITQGTYRRRLKLAAIAMMTGAGLLIGILIPAA